MLLLVELGPADRQRGTVGRVLEERALGRAERPARRLGKAQVADGRALDNERHLAPPSGFNAGRLARRRPHLAAGGAHHARPIVLAGDLHLRGLDREQLGQAGGQLGEQLVELECLERGGQVLEL